MDDVTIAATGGRGLDLITSAGLQWHFAEHERYCK
ncbi:hypothetical protein BN979_02733 [Mycolicibacterium vulneris]|nr:hypothetical protein BN979_02733 [Mycolicibacterium vulneris]